MPFVRRRPLLKAAGAAAIGGAAYHAGQRRAMTEAQPQGEPQQAYAPPPPAPAPSGGMSPQVIEQLKQLGELREQGVLTEDEFEQQKQRLLAGS